MREATLHTSISYFRVRPRLLHRAFFNRTTVHHNALARADSNSNHYETLNLPSTATSSEIKKRFYALSKAHHPDRNPNDPHASSRFVKISEAYAILGSPPKRERYDRDLRISSRSAPGADTFTSGPAGGRPASGLSRRRTQFRGPPPSFYRQGGWDAQSTKRANANASASSTTSGVGGFGPAGPQMGRNDVPHFDRAAHFRAQEHRELWRRSRRRKSDDTEPEVDGGMTVNFAFVGGIIMLAVMIPGLFIGTPTRGRRDEVNKKA
ncbi:MAG: hypothetical protein M1840_002267 [Geoglossum simile]|nr:MAG: hypothetical protein M1840_002267 [Geoglossum simile]